MRPQFVRRVERGPRAEIGSSEAFTGSRFLDSAPRHVLAQVFEGQQRI